MARVTIREYEHITLAAGGGVAVAKEPAVARQTLTPTGASTQSVGFNTRTRFIRVHTDSIIAFDVGSVPVAIDTGDRMAANQTEYFGVDAGHKIAVIIST